MNKIHNVKSLQNYLESEVDDMKLINITFMIVDFSDEPPELMYEPNDSDSGLLEGLAGEYPVYEIITMAKRGNYSPSDAFVKFSFRDKTISSIDYDELALLIRSEYCKILAESIYEFGEDLPFYDTDPMISDYIQTKGRVDNGTN